MSSRRLVAGLSAIALGAALAATSLPVAAAEAEDSATEAEVTPTEAEEPALDPQVAEDVKTIDKLLKQLKIKGEPTIVVDGVGDVIDPSTQQVADGPGHGDVRVMAYLVTKAGKGQVKAMDKRINAKSTDPIRGAQSKVARGQWLVIAVVTDGNTKRKAPDGTQGIIGLGGPGAVPFYVGSGLDPYAGNESAVIFGKFPEVTSLLTGSASLAGLTPGERPGWTDAPAEAFGFRQGNVWVMAVPLDGEVPTIELTFQSLAEGRGLIDEVTTAAGIDRFPADGSAFDGLCYSGRTFITKDAAGDIATYQIELAIDTDEPVDAAIFDGFGLQTADGQAIPGGWQVFPGPGSGSTAIGNFEAPPVPEAVISFDTWATPESHPQLNPTNLRDGSTLILGTDTGSYFGGGCGQLPPGPGELTADATDPLIEAFGFDPSTLEHIPLPNPDGSQNIVYFDAEVRQPAVVLGTDGRPSSEADFDRRLATSYCEVTDVDLGISGALELCPDGTQRFFWLEPFTIDGLEQDFGRTWVFESRPSGFPDGGLPLGTELDPADPLPPGSVDIIRGVVTPYQSPYDGLDGS